MKNFLIKHQNKFQPKKIIITLFLVMIIPVLSLGIIFPAGANYQETNKTLFYLVTVFSLTSAIFGMLNVTTYSLIDFKNPQSKKKFKWWFLLFSNLAMISLIITDIIGKRYVNIVIDLGLMASNLLQFFLWFNEGKELKLNKLVLSDLLKYAIIATCLGIAFWMFSYLLSTKIIGSPEETNALLWSFFDGFGGSTILVAGVVLSKKRYTSQGFYIVNGLLNIFYFGIGFYFRFGQANWPLMVLFIFYGVINIVNYINWKYFV